MSGKSAKDLAFERERAGYKKRIRELEARVENERRLCSMKEDEINTLRDRLAEKEDWIGRLLEYMDLSEEDMKNIIEKDKHVAAALNHMAALTNIFRLY